MATKKSAADLLKNETELKQAAENAFKRLDRDNSGFLSREEMEVAIKSFMMAKGQEADKEQIDLVFKKIDKNKDGKISFREFFSMTKEILAKAK